MKEILNKTIEMIKAPDEEIMSRVREYWDSLAKPVGSLGLGEDIITQIAGITGSMDICIDKKALVVFCADNGVVEEGVVSSPQEITAFMAKNFSREKTSVAIMCAKAGVDIFPVDVGMVVDVDGVEKRKRCYGTFNMTKGPAMSREDALFAITAGIELAWQKKEEGYDLLMAGEMGIGNTTSTTAVLCALLGKNPKEIVGRGAGLSDEGLSKKTEAIDCALAINQPNISDPVDVISKVGGFDIAAMTGFYLGAASKRLPVIMDGVISSAAALCAVRLCATANDYIIPSHLSAESGMKYVMKELGKKATLNADFRLGEGTGAVAIVPFIELMNSVYKRLPVL